MQCPLRTCVYFYKSCSWNLAKYSSNLIKLELVTCFGIFQNKLVSSCLYNSVLFYRISVIKMLMFIDIIVSLKSRTKVFLEISKREGAAMHALCVGAWLGILTPHGLLTTARSDPKTQSWEQPHSNAECNPENNQKMSLWLHFIQTK